MTFLSSRVIGRGSAPPPAVVALIETPSFSSVVARLPPVGRTRRPRRFWRSARTKGAGAKPQGKRDCDAREFGVSQQKIKQKDKDYRKFLVNYKKFSIFMKFPSCKSSFVIRIISEFQTQLRLGASPRRPQNHPCRVRIRSPRSFRLQAAPKAPPGRSRVPFPAA